MTKTKYYIHMSNTSVLLIFFTVLFYKEKILLLTLASLTIHELGHIFMCKALNVKIGQIHIHPHGINILPDKLLIPKKQILISVAGPLSSLILSLLFFALYNKFNLKALKLWASVNFLLFLVNVVPAFPLDGGELLRAVLCFFKGHIEAVNTVKKVSVYVYVFIFLLGIIIAFSGGFNISLPLFCVAGFLKLSACNVYKYNWAVFILSKDFVSNPKRIRRVKLKVNQNPLSMLKYISTEYTLVADVYSCNGQYIKSICQNEILNEIINIK